MTLEELKTEMDGIKDNKDYHKKLDICTQIIALDPKNAIAFNNRGTAYHALKQHDKAIEDYNQAIILEPEDVSGFYNRGNVYHGLKEYNKAIEDYTQAIILNPEYADTFYNRGITYYDLKQYDKAIEDYNQAIILNPEYASAFNNRGIAYREIGKEEKAVADLKEANELDSTLIVREELKETKQKTEETEQKVIEVQILTELKKEHQADEDKWFEVSQWAAGLTLLVIIAALILIAGDDTYILYIFCSVITFIIIRQYTNAKGLRIEASNRLAMAKMFEKVRNKKDDSDYKKEFLPKLADAIVYSTRKEHKPENNIVETIVSAFKNK